MHPTFRIFADSREITSAVKDRLLELTVTDEAGIKSDQVRLTFDDRRGVNGVLAPLPKMGMKLEISLGYEETGVTKMGIYVVDEVEISHPPATLRVNAKAANLEATAPAGWTITPQSQKSSWISRSYSSGSKKRSATGS